MQVAIPLFPRFTALDAVGPYEVLSRIPGTTVTFVAAEPGPVSTDTQMLTMHADVSLADVPEPEVVLVPGGPGVRDLLEDEQLLAWIRHAHEHSTWTTSVCTGSLLLAAAGVLDGLEATAHWMELEQLGALGAVPVERRVVEQGKVITAAGVSAGIDMALTLASRVAGKEVAQAIQLGIEYDPEPPFDAGSPRSAPEPIVELVRAVAAANPGTM